MPPVARYKFSGRITQRPSAMDEWQLRVDKKHYQNRLQQARCNPSNIDHFIPERLARPSPPKKQRKRKKSRQQILIDKEIQRSRDGRGGWIFAKDPNEIYPVTNLIPHPPSFTTTAPSPRRPRRPRRRNKRKQHKSTIHRPPIAQEAMLLPTHYNHVLLQSITGGSSAKMNDMKLTRYTRDASRRRKHDTRNIVKTMHGIQQTKMSHQGLPSSPLPLPPKVRRIRRRKVLLPV